MRGEGFNDILFYIASHLCDAGAHQLPLLLLVCIASCSVQFYIKWEDRKPFLFVWLLLNCPFPCLCSFFCTITSTGVEGDRQGGRRGSLDIKWRRSLLRMEDGKWSCFLFHSRFPPFHTYPVWYFGINWRTLMLMFHLLTNPIFNSVLHAKNISFITRSSKGRIPNGL